MRVNKLEHMLSGNGSRKCRERKGKRNTGMMMTMRMMTRRITCPRTTMMHSQVDPEFRPTRREFREAHKEGDS